MSNYIFTVVLMLLVIGCQSEAPESDLSENSQQQPPMNGQMQQPQMDIDVSEEELELFLDASERARSLQMDAEQEMLAVLEEEGLEVETYSTIAQSLQMGQPADSIDASAEDMARYENASVQIEEIGSAMDQDVTSAIEDEGMEMERFQEINMAIQMDPQLQQRAQALFQQRQGDNMMQQQPGQ
ncbi:MAG: DUF4168 domain-containing protein [Balneolaceae bacterium]